MQIAIIGAGNVGKALATSFARAGHEVTLAASSERSARAAAEETGVGAASSAVDATAGADVIVLAVPYVGAGEQVAAELSGVIGDRIVIDATNPIKPDYSGLAVSDTSAAETFQRLLPGAKVVKAFNTIFAGNQASPSLDIDGFVAADDAEAKQQVIGLVEAMGFTPVDAGPLAHARFLEGMAWINIGLNAANGWSWSSAWRLENKG